MCAAVSDSKADKMKSKQIFSVFNRIKSAVTSKKPMLTADAVPADDSRMASIESIPTQLAVPNRNALLQQAVSSQFIQNYMDQTNQSLMMVGTQQNYSISHCPNVHIGETKYYGPRRPTRKNSHNENENNTNRPKRMSKTVSGKYF